MTNGLSIDEQVLRKAALNYRATNNHLRQKILRLIHERAFANVTTIYEKLNIEQSVASTHLAVLRRAGLVYTEREGKSIRYAINYQRLKLLHEVAEALNTGSDA